MNNLTIMEYVSLFSGEMVENAVSTNLASNASFIINQATPELDGFYKCDADNGIAPPLEKTFKITVIGKINAKKYLMSSRIPNQAFLFIKRVFINSGNAPYFFVVFNSQIIFL